MTPMKIKHLTFLLLLTSFISISQELPDVVPPSPEAASLGKFTEVPVSLYSGLANISIPITSFEVEGRSFPVSLSYHSRGVKVNETASRVGIGWALNAGGAVSRQTRHIADDASFGYLDAVNNKIIPALASGSWFTSQTARDNFLGQSSVIEEKTDRIPDAYNLQAGGVSAKFIMDYNLPHDVLLQKYDDLKVSYVLGVDNQPGTVPGEERIISFTAVDGQGYTYYFGISKDGARYARNWDLSIGNYSFPLIEGGYTIGSSDSSFKTYNTWQLMDIESPNGELASFHYEDEVSEYFRRSYDKKEENNDVINYSSKVQSHQYQLRKIVHRGGEIVFEKATVAREDLDNSYALRKIIINDYNQNFVKSFLLNHSYQEDTDNDTQNSALLGLEPKASKRLFLDTVVEQGENGVNKPPYLLTYSDVELPNRFSNAQDYWGYYNGADNGQFLTFSNDGSRRVDVDNSMAGMLTGITYPTGGVTEFVYEHNKGIKEGQFQNVLIPDVNPISTSNTHNAFLGHLMYIDSTNYGSYVGYQGNVYSKEFTIDNFVNGSFKYDIWFGDPTGCSETVITGDCRFRVYLKGNGQTYNLYKGSHSIGNISSGTYTLIVDPVQAAHDPINNTDDHFTAGVRWEEAVNESQTYASGKRIKKIKFYDTDGSLASFKEYQYEGGKILGISSFHSIRNTAVTVQGTTFYQLDPLGAVPGSPLSTYQGNSIGYETVTEYYGNKDINIGKAVHTYTLLEDTGDYTSFPYHPPTDNEWLRGLLVDKKDYRRESGGSDYTLVKQTEYKYLYANEPGAAPDDPAGPTIFTPLPTRIDEDEDYVPGSTGLIGLPYINTRTLFRLPLIHLYYPPGGSGSNTGIGDLHYKMYHFTGGTMSPFSTKETFYYDNGNTINYSKNSYDYAKHYQVASTLRRASDDKTLITAYTYPQSINSIPGSVIRNLQDQNRHVPLEIRTYKDENEDGIANTDEALNYLKTSYAWTDGVLEPMLVQASKALDENSLEDIIHYHKYNPLGKPLEVSKADGPKISYIWGYDQQYPIAKIENASYNDIASALGISVAALRNYDESNLSQINSLRNSLSTAMVSTFRYEPMVGIKQMTDPRGYTMTYIYDELNRLKEVRDQDNKLVSENKYNYKNQQ